MPTAKDIFQIFVPDGALDDDEEDPAPAPGLPTLEGLVPVGLPMGDDGCGADTTLPLPAST